MVSGTTKPQPIIVIVGPTGSGKSAAAVRLVKDYPIEIICADSRTVYRGASLGTAKPAAPEQQTVPHWGLDLAEPGERFSAYDFQTYAKAKIIEVRGRGKLPIIVGGSGLYIDSLVYDFSLRPGNDTGLRQELESISRLELVKRARQEGYHLAHDELSKRHLVRVIETKGQRSFKKKLMTGVAMFGIWPPDKSLKESIAQRSDYFYSQGFSHEISGLIRRHGKQITKTCGISYRYYINYLEGAASLEEAKQQLVSGEWQYARRQRTWFKRNQDIEWSASSSECYNKVIQFLNKNCSN